MANEGDLWVLQRFAQRIMHKRIDVRREALSFFVDLTHKLEVGPLKDFVIEKLDLITLTLYVLTTETQATIVVQCWNLIDNCIHYNSNNKFDVIETNEEQIANVMNINVRWLENFFASDGESILFGVKDLSLIHI